MRNIVKTKLKTVQAFTPRGGTQLHEPADSAAPDEPEDDPAPSAQQSFSQPQRQNSGYDPSWSSPSLQNFSPPYQPNHFAPQQYQQASQYYNNTPQQHSPPLPGWVDPSLQQPQQYPPHTTQPPQTPPNPTPQPGYTSNGYNSSIHSGYNASISSAHSQYSQNYQHSSPPPVISSPPPVPSPHRTTSMYSPPQTQDLPYEPPLVQRSHTMPAQAYWPRTRPNHDCDENINTYTGRCKYCYP